MANMHETIRERLRNAHIVRPPMDRMKTFVIQGEAGLVAKMLILEPKLVLLPDDEKRMLVTEALHKNLEMVQDPKVIKAVTRKIKTIGSGHKEGNALTRQFEQMFPEARSK